MASGRERREGVPVTVVALGAIRSCGVTTLAVGLAATWPAPRRALLVEADPAGGTLAAASGWPPEPGLASLAAATRRAGGLAALFDHCHPLPGGTPVLAAPASGDQARRVLAMLGGSLAGLGVIGCDVLLDCGRLEPSGAAHDTGGSALARFATADRAILVARPRLADLHALASWLSGGGASPLISSDRLGIVLVGDGPYLDGEVESALGVGVLGRVPNDVEAADALLAVSADDRALRRAPLVRAARSLAAELARAAQPAGTVQHPSVEQMTEEAARTPRARVPMARLAMARLAAIGSFRPWRASDAAASSSAPGTANGSAVSNGPVVSNGPGGGVTQ